MAKKIVVVSRLVDATISTAVRGYDIEIFPNLTELYQLTETTPIRCNKLVVVGDVTAVDANQAFRSLIKIVGPESVYFTADEVIFVCQPSDPALMLLNFILDDKRLQPVTVVEGELTREFIASVLKGTHEKDSTPTRMDVIRMRKKDHIAQSKAAANSLQTIEDDLVYTDEDLLEKIPEQEEHKILPTPNNRSSKMIQIAGNKGRGKTVFRLLLAQCISDTHKVCLVENDFDYFSLSHFLALSKIECLKITVSEFIANPSEAVYRVRNSPYNLVVFTEDSSFRTRNIKASYVQRIVYDLMNKDIDYFLIESDLRDIVSKLKTIVVFNNELPLILRDIELLPAKNSYMEYICLARSTLKDVQIINSVDMQGILEELLNVTLPPIPIYEITSLLKGESVYDLRRFM